MIKMFLKVVELSGRLTVRQHRPVHDGFNPRFIKARLPDTAPVLTRYRYSNVTAGDRRSVSTSGQSQSPRSFVTPPHVTGT